MTHEAVIKDLHRYNQKGIQKKYRLDFWELLGLLILWDVVDWLGQASLIANTYNTLFEYKKTYPIKDLDNIEDYWFQYAVCIFESLLKKGMIAKREQNAYKITTYGTEVLEEIDLYVNGERYDKIEALLKEYPSLLALWVAILWSFTAILVAVFDD